jgi:hypothetical protein
MYPREGPSPASLPKHLMLVGVGALNVPFTIPAASAKTSAGVSPLHALTSGPPWP